MATEEEAYLRQLIGDMQPATGDPLLSDEEITLILAANKGFMNAAAAEGWAIKAGRYASLVDISEGGTDRNLSQKFKQAYQMANFYVGRVEKEFPAAESSRIPVVGRVAKILGGCDGVVVNAYIGAQEPGTRRWLDHKMDPYIQ